MSTLPKRPAKEFQDKLDSDGGFTYDPRDDQFVSGGVMASVFGGEKEVNPAPATDVDINHFQASNQKSLLSSGQFFGGWRYGGSDFLDRSVQFTDPPPPPSALDRAMDFGKKNAQIGVYDADDDMEYIVRHGEELGGGLLDLLPPQELNALDRSNNELLRRKKAARLADQSTVRNTPHMQDELRRRNPRLQPQGKQLVI